MAIETLRHTEVPVVNGVEDAKVIVLNTGAKITAEDQAMLMALHSRSPAGIQSHLARLAQAGSVNFMQQFYVGYGHGSIGDCGNTAVFVEGVSMLAAKAIQDYPLYRGQECSTRYIDFSNQPFVAPANKPEIRTIQEDLRKLYLAGMEPTIAHLKSQFPDVDNEGAKYEKAIKARAFDILRSLLPAGASTNVAWNVDLRQARDRLFILRNHPLPEVNAIAQSLEQALHQAHPNSFSLEKRYPEQEKYTRNQLDQYYLLNSPDYMPEELSLDLSKLDGIALERAIPPIQYRPPKSELPKFLDELGVLSLKFPLDFASYRDIQRHRAITIRMPELTTKLGFEPWYLEQMPEDLRTETEGLLKNIEQKLSQGTVSSRLAQYAIPMGYRIPCQVTGGLPGLVYMLELRSTTAVHPTLRRRALEAGKLLTEELGITLHLDESNAPFDTKRGDHDITERTN